VDIVWDTQEVELNSWSNSDGDWDTPVALAAFPFAAGWPYVLEIQAGQSGYTVSVNGIEQTSFDYQYDPATVDAVRASGAHRCRVQYGSGDSVDDADGAYTCTDDVACSLGAVGWEPEEELISACDADPMCPGYAMRGCGSSTSPGATCTGGRICMAVTLGNSDDYKTCFRGARAALLQILGAHEFLENHQISKAH
jgi:hypothetical protein